MVSDELRDMYKKLFEAERNATLNYIKTHGIAQQRRVGQIHSAVAYEGYRGRSKKTGGDPKKLPNPGLV